MHTYCQYSINPTLYNIYARKVILFTDTFVSQQDLQKVGATAEFTVYNKERKFQGQLSSRHKHFVDTKHNYKQPKPTLELQIYWPYARQCNIEVSVSLITTEKAI